MPAIKGNPQTEENAEMERRFVVAELRAVKSETDQPTIEGIAAVYDQETDLGFFREVIRPGAFARVLSESPDTIAALNHNWDIVLGRTKANTLHLSDTPAGLKYVIDVNTDDPEAMSVYAKVARGDIHQSSFAFTVRKEEWTNPEDKSQVPLRSITEIDELYDVSPVTFPAYPTTSASVRSKLIEFNRAAPSRDQEVPEGEADLSKTQERLTRQKRLLDLEK